MTYQQVIDHFRPKGCKSRGAAAAAARKLGFSRATLSLWKKNGIPASRQRYIHEKTRGKLKAEKVA